MRASLSTKSNREIFDKQQNVTTLANHTLKCTNADEMVKEAVLLESDNDTVWTLERKRLGWKFTSDGRINKGFDQSLSQNDIQQTQAAHLLSSGQLDIFQQARGQKRILSNSVSNDCTKREGEAITMALLEAFIEQGWSFTALDWSSKKKTKLIAALELLHPEYVKNFLPTTANFTGWALDAHFSKMSINIQGRLARALSKGFGSVVSDGSEDASGSSIVNMLLRLESHTDNSRRTFCLDSAFTATDRINSSAYVSLIANVMEKYGGMCGIPESGSWVGRWV